MITIDITVSRHVIELLFRSSRIRERTIIVKRPVINYEMIFVSIYYEIVYAILWPTRTVFRIQQINVVFKKTIIK